MKKQPAKKLSMKLDDLQVESFDTGREELTKEAEGGVRAYYGGQHTMESGCRTQTTCEQVICDCSMGWTDCDATCPNYMHAEAMSCDPFVC
jgi:hypothetical protein